MGVDSNPSSSVRAAATAARHLDARQRSVRRRSPAPAASAASARAAGGRTGCRRSPRRSRPPARGRSLRPGARRPRRAGARRARFASDSPRSARSSAAARRSGNCLGRARHRDQHRRRRRPAQKRAEQLDRRGIRPVHVVQSEHERLGCRHPLEQLPHRAMRAVALVLEGRLAARRNRTARGDPRELAAHIAVERVEAARVETGDVLVERVHEDPEGQVALELRGAAREHDAAASRRRACPSSPSRRVLPMPGSPRARARAGPSVAPAPQRRVERPSSAARPTRCSGTLAMGASAASISARRIRVANQGRAPMSGRGRRWEARRMPRYLVHHRHQPHECGIAFASFKGHESPLRHRATLASCPSGGHAIWWAVEATTEAAALRCCRSSWPSAPPRPGSARSRSHDPRNAPEGEADAR